MSRRKEQPVPKDWATPAWKSRPIIRRVVFTFGERRRGETEAEEGKTRVKLVRGKLTVGAG